MSKQLFTFIALSFIFYVLASTYYLVETPKILHLNIMAFFSISYIFIGVNMFFNVFMSTKNLKKKIKYDYHKICPLFIFSPIFNINLFFPTHDLGFYFNLTIPVIGYLVLKEILFYKLSVKHIDIAT